MDPKTDWKIERVLEVVLLGFLIAAAIGFFGGRPQPRMAEASDTGIRLEVGHQRVARVGNVYDVTIKAENTGDTRADNVLLRINRSYFEGFVTQRILPQPASESIEGEHLMMSFRKLDPGDTLEVTVTLQAEHGGQYPAMFEAEFIGPEPASAIVDFQTIVIP